tara:strand:+ start:5779 stop:7845 length:2067 start_codon:yes stop_codon:yes gene_type:complete
MAFSGGTFSRTFDCTTDRDNGVKILASKFDTELDGMAVGLSTAILKDGTQTCTAAIPFQQGITLPDDKTIAFGTNSDVLIQYDETTTDSLKISAAEGAGLAITLMADEGDDAGDEWKLNIADGGTLTLGNDINSAGTYVTHLTITPNATVANSTMAVAGNLTVGGALTLGSGAVISEAELETIDGITPGTVLASKAMVVDSDKDITGGRNLTITGELDAATLDISGNADIDGTLETDALSIDGTTITTTAAEINLIDGGTARGTTAVASGDGILINDAGTMRMTNVDTVSTYFAGHSVGGSNIVTTGALNSGSITSGFGSIDNGSSAITTTGTVTAGELTVDTNTLHVDSTNNRVGVGLVSPAVPLHVKDSAPGFALQASGSITSGNRADFSAFNSDASTVGLIRFGAVTDNVGTEIQFHNRPAGGSLTEAMRIDSSGNVGISTTPESFAKLEVKTSTDKNIAIFDNAAGPTIGGITDAGGSASLRIAGSPLIMTGNGGSGAEAMRIDSIGQVGLSGSANSFDTTGSVNGLQLYYETDTGIATIGSYSSGGGTDLSFQTNNGGSASTEKMRVAFTGKVQTLNRDFGFLNHGTPVTLADDGSIVINASEAGCGLLAIYDRATGSNGLYRVGFGGSAVVSAGGSLNFAAADSDGSICVFASSHTITIKNRIGGSRGFFVSVFMAGNDFAG